MPLLVLFALGWLLASAVLGVLLGPALGDAAEEQFANDGEEDA